MKTVRMKTELKKKTHNLTRAIAAKIGFATWSLVTFFAVQNAYAVDEYELVDDLSAVTSQKFVDSMLSTLAFGADHRQVRGASPLGNALGLDVGVDLVVIPTPDDFQSALNIFSGGSKAPKSLPLPRLNIHKGLPGGFDLGFSWISLQGFSVIGGALSWAIIRPASGPQIGARLSFTTSDLSFISTTTVSADGIVSFKLPVIEPFVGLGMQYGSGKLELGDSAATLPSGIEPEYTKVSPRGFAGLSMKFLIIKVAGEVNYSFTGLMTYGAKVAISI